MKGSVTTWDWATWRADAAVALLDPSSRCCWFERLGVMLQADGSGILSATIQDLAGMARVSVDAAARAISSIAVRRVADVSISQGEPCNACNADPSAVVTLVCRKMQRDAERRQNRREKGRNRVQRYRERKAGQPGNASVTQPVTLRRSETVPSPSSPSHTLPLTPTPSRPAAQAAAAVENRPTPAPVPAPQAAPEVGQIGADGSPVVLVFPCVVGVRSKGQWYAVTQCQIDEWRETYPAVDVAQVCRHALQWIKGNLRNRKTADAMPTWIAGVWLQREQNKAPAMRAQGQRPAGPNSGPTHAPNTLTKDQTDANRRDELAKANEIAAQQRERDARLSSLTDDQLKRLAARVCERVGPDYAALYEGKDPRRNEPLRWKIYELLNMEGTAA